MHECKVDCGYAMCNLQFCVIAAAELSIYQNYPCELQGTGEKALVRTKAYSIVNYTLAKR
jgi:hypothetical protein